MPKTFDLSRHLNRKQQINRNLYIAIAAVLGISIFTYLIVLKREDIKDALLGSILLDVFFCIIYYINKFFNDFFRKCKEPDILIYTLFKDRILYKNNKGITVVFLNEIEYVSLHFTKSSSICILHFKIKNKEGIDCMHIVQGEFHKYLKKYLNEHKIKNNL